MIGANDMSEDIVELCQAFAIDCDRDDHCDAFQRAAVEIVALREQLAEARSALGQCAAQFNYYAENHEKAGKLDKATTNREFAEMAASAARSDDNG